MTIFDYVVALAGVVVLDGAAFWWFHSLGPTVLSTLAGVLATAAGKRKGAWGVLIFAVLLATAHEGWALAGSLNATPTPPVEVQPTLGWSGPVNTGQTVTFTIPLKAGYPWAVIRFKIQDADPNGPICAADTELGLTVGPLNNQRPVGTIWPWRTMRRVHLAGLGGHDASVRLTVGTLPPGKGNCPVTVHVPGVALKRN